MKRNSFHTMLWPSKTSCLFNNCDGVRRINVSLISMRAHTRPHRATRASPCARKQPGKNCVSTCRTLVPFSKQCLHSVNLSTGASSHDTETLCYVSSLVEAETMCALQWHWVCERGRQVKTMSSTYLGEVAQPRSSTHCIHRHVTHSMVTPGKTNRGFSMPSQRCDEHSTKP